MWRVFLQNASRRFRENEKVVAVEVTDNRIILDEGPDFVIGWGFLVKPRLVQQSL